MYSSSEEEDPDFKDIAFPQDTAMHQVRIFCVSVSVCVWKEQI